MRLKLLGMCVVLGAGCGAVTGEESGTDAGSTEPRATWHQDVAPIVHARCVGCHTEGGIAPFSLETYDDAQPVAGFMLSKVEAGEMPPWSAVSTDDCTPRHDWKDDARVTASELEVLRAWVEDGLAAGDPETAAPLPPPPVFELQGVTASLAPTTPYTTSGYVDEQVCFVLDPGFIGWQWLTGLQVVPGDLEVVHHAVVMAVPPENAEAVRLQGGDDGTFQCFGAVGLEGAYTVGVWVLGARPFETPATTGIPMAPGTVLVMNIHYHPTGFDHAPDLTTVDLRTQAVPTAKSFFITALGSAPGAPQLQAGPNDRGAPEFRIPANVAGHTERMVFEIDSEDPRRFPMTAIFPHMHYVGVDMKVTINGECLVSIPRWDFDWQRTYFYDAAIENLPTVGDGDVVEIECGYDNTMANPFVRRMLLEEDLEAPIDVLLGDETTDEMCLIGVGIIL